MQEYLHNACHTFFETAITPHYLHATHGQQRQTTMEVHTMEGRKHYRRPIRRDH